MNRAVTQPLGTDKNHLEPQPDKKVAVKFHFEPAKVQCGTSLTVSNAKVPPNGTGKVLLPLTPNQLLSGRTLWSRMDSNVGVTVSGEERKG